MGAEQRPLPEPADVKTVALVGLGLMGASLGFALKRHCPNWRVLAYARREQTIADALPTGMIDAGSTDPAEILPQADLTVLCVPIQPSIDFGRQYAALWRPGSVVTDVGSVKTPVVHGLRGKLSEHGVHFIGSHPMAGTEKSGLANAKPDLYDGAVVFLTHIDGDSASAARLVSAFWEALGMEPHVLAPDSHDMLVARTSHVLHLLSYAAARSYLAEEKSELATGGGFRDFTRIAASSPAMWREIFTFNREHVLAALDEFLGDVERLRGMLLKGDWDSLTEYLTAARENRCSWYSKWQRRRGELS